MGLGLWDCGARFMKEERREEERKRREDDRDGGR